jgi:hypothetical protein
MLRFFNHMYQLNERVKGCEQEPFNPKSVRLRFERLQPVLAMRSQVPQQVILSIELLTTARNGAGKEMIAMAAIEMSFYTPLTVSCMVATMEVALERALVV